MTVGMPGTGIGGLFYLVLALLMPFHELYLTARGRSSRERWRLVLGQLALALGIIVAVVATGLLLTHGLRREGPLGTHGAAVLLVPAAVAGGLLVLVTVSIRGWALLAYPGRSRDADRRPVR